LDANPIRLRQQFAASTQGLSEEFYAPFWFDDAADPYGREDQKNHNQNVVRPDLLTFSAKRPDYCENELEYRLLSIREHHRLPLLRAHRSRTSAINQVRFSRVPDLSVVSLHTIRNRNAVTQRLPQGESRWRDSMTEIVSTSGLRFIESEYCRREQGRDRDKR